MKVKIRKYKMSVLSKLQRMGLDNVVDEITKCRNPEEARVIRMTKNEVAVFENTEKAAVLLRGMLLRRISHRCWV